MPSTHTHTQISKNEKPALLIPASNSNPDSAPHCPRESGTSSMSLPSFLAVRPPSSFMLSVVLNKMDIFFSMRLRLVLLKIRSSSGTCEPVWSRTCVESLRPGRTSQQWWPVWTGSTQWARHLATWLTRTDPFIPHTTPWSRCCWSPGGPTPASVLLRTASGKHEVEARPWPATSVTLGELCSPLCPSFLTCQMGTTALPTVRQYRRCAQHGAQQIIEMLKNNQDVRVDKCPAQCLGCDSARMLMLFPLTHTH